MKILFILLNFMFTLNSYAKYVKIMTQPAYLDYQTFNIAIDYPFKEKYSIAASFYQEVKGPTVGNHTGTIFTVSPYWYPIADKGYLAFASIDLHMGLNKITLLGETIKDSKFHLGVKIGYEWILLKEYMFNIVIRLGLMHSKVFKFIKLNPSYHLLFWEVGTYF